MLSIFISSYVFFKVPFEAYFGYAVFLMYFPVFFAKYGIPRAPVLLFMPLFLSGVLYTLIGLNTPQQFYKVFIGFFASVLFYHYVVEQFAFKIKELFQIYMRFSYWVAILGLIQIVSYFVGFRYGYDYTWLFNKWGYIPGGIGIRLNSIFGEPAYFAATISPAFFVSIYNFTVAETLFVTRKQSIVIAVAYFLTFSSLGILGVFLTAVLLLVNLGFFRYAILFVPLSIFLFNYSYQNVPEFRERYDGTFEIFSTANYKSYEINGSSFVLYNNYHVALENFKRNPLFGTGLGSHPVAFDKYSLTNLEGAVEIDFNKMDANSMFLRLMSETGIYGLFVMIFFIFKCWVWRQRSADKTMWVMSNGIAVMILLYMIRQGHYFLNGFPFFLWMFYYIYVENKKLMDGDSAKNEFQFGPPSIASSPKIQERIE